MNNKRKKRLLKEVKKGHNTIRLNGSLTRVISTCSVLCPSQCVLIANDLSCHETPVLPQNEDAVIKTGGTFFVKLILPNFLMTT